MVTSIEKSGKNRPLCDTVRRPEPRTLSCPSPHHVHVVIGVNLSVREVLVLSASNYKCDFLLHRSCKRMADRFEVPQVFTPLSNPWVCGSLSTNWLWQRRHSPDCLLCGTLLPADVAPLLALEKRLWGARSQDPQSYSCREMNSAGCLRECGHRPFTGQGSGWAHSPADTLISFSLAKDPSKRG